MKNEKFGMGHGPEVFLTFVYGCAVCDIILIKNLFGLCIITTNKMKVDEFSFFVIVQLAQTGQLIEHNWIEKYFAVYVIIIWFFF